MRLKVLVKFGRYRYYLELLCEMLEIQWGVLDEVFGKLCQLEIFAVNC